MDTERISKSYNDFLLRFNINCELEEPVWSLLSSKGWNDLTSNSDKFRADLQQWTNCLNGQPYHLYIASGSFNKGSIRSEEGRIVGRTEKNLKRILTVPLDADYIKYILYKKGIEPKDKEKIQEYAKKLYALPDDSLTLYLDKHLNLIKNILQKAKIPYSEIMRSGYGHYMKLLIDPEDQTRIDEIREFHKSLLSHLNKVAGFELFDKQCTDAGTRVTRMEGSCNLKNPKIPRLVRVIDSNNQFYKLDELTRILPKKESQSGKTSSQGLKAHETMLQIKREKIIEIFKPYWVKTQRHELAKDLTGFLAKQGVDWGEVANLILQIAALCRDEETGNRIKDVKTTFEKVRNGEEVLGYKGLEQILSPEDLQTLTSLFDSPRVQVVDEDEEIETEKIIKSLEFPNKVYETGIFKTYVESFSEHSETPPQFHFSTIACYLGLRLGRDVYSYYPRPLFPNFYVCNVAPTGNKKSTGGYLYDLSEGIPRDEFQIMSGVSSSEGLVSDFTEEIKKNERIPIPEKKVLVVQNELTTVFKKGERQSTSTLLEYLNDFYDYLPYIDVPTRHNPLRAERPCLSILSTTTFGAFEKILTEHHIRMGFLNRFCFFVGKVSEPIANPKIPKKEVMDSIHKQLDSILNFAEKLREKSNNEIGFSDGTQELWEKYYNDLFHEKDNLSELEIEISERTHVFARKFAMLFAIAREGANVREHTEAALFNKAIFITEEDLYRACLIADYLKDSARYLVTKLGETKYTRLEERMLKHFKANKGKAFSVSALRKIAGGYYSRFVMLNTLKNLAVEGVKKVDKGGKAYYGTF